MPSSTHDNIARHSWAAILLVVWVAGGLYVHHHLDRGWWPNNAGAIAHGAERVLHGELPHRDFDEIYTGGVNFVHALAFKLLGPDLASIRRPLFLLFLTWIPSVFYVATRFTGPWIAGTATLLAAAWSLPIYAEPIASWYNLFLATHGAAALLRYLETERRRWLFAAGVCGGLSILAKIIGVYFLAAAGLALLHREQHASATGGRSGRRDRHPAGTTPARSPGYSIFLIGGLVACTTGTAVAVYRNNGVDGIIHFVVPIAMLSALLVWNELDERRGASGRRFAALGRLALPVAAGAGLVIAAFLAPYALSASLGDLFEGLFVKPMTRFRVTSNPPPILAVASLPAVVLLARSWRVPRGAAYALAALLAAGLAAVVWRGDRWLHYPLIIASIRALVPVVIFSGVVVLAVRGPIARRSSAKSGRGRRGRRKKAAARRTPPAAEPDASAGAGPDPGKVFVLLAAVGLCSLVQFPVAETIYAFFIAPLGLLGLLAVVAHQRAAARPVLAVVLLFYLAFSVVWINTSVHVGVGEPPYVKDDQTEALEIDRAGGIRVRARDKDTYEALVAVLRRRVSGDFIYATPDCAEVYFLSGFGNPTRTLYDFFDDPERRDARIMALLEEKDIQVIVLNRAPQYSPPPSPELNGYFTARYPVVTEIGRFHVRSTW